MLGIEGSGDEHQVSLLIDKINSAWTKGRPQDLNELFHERIVMAFPGFGGRAAGKTKMIAGFEDFCTNARLHRFAESDRQIDIVGDVAVATFAFDLIYEREGQKYQSAGRDLWVFERSPDNWLAVWRTILDVSEESVDET
jgi:ketosteroid isomerase-like protein